MVAMLVKPATTRECEYLFRKKLERRPNRYPDYLRRHRQSPRAAISLVQSNSASGSTQSQPCTISSAVGAGDLIIVGINWGSFGQTYTVSDDHGNNYTQFPNVEINNSSFNDLNAFWAINTSAQSSLTVTVAMSGGVNHTLRVAVFEYNCTTGWAASPVDHGNSQHNVLGVIVGTPNTISPSVVGTLGWTAIQFTGPVTGINMTAGGSTLFVEQPSSGGVGGTGWRNDGRADSADFEGMTATSNQTATYNWTNSVGYSSLIANFLPGTGGGGGTAFEDDSYMLVSGAPDSNVTKF